MHDQWGRHSSCNYFSSPGASLTTQPVVKAAYHNNFGNEAVLLKSVEPDVSGSVMAVIPGLHTPCVTPERGLDFFT